MAKRLTSALAVAAAATLAAGLAVTAQASAAPAHSGSARASAPALIRHVVKYHSSSRLPVSVKHANGGAMNLGDDNTLQRYVNRSNSPHPAVVHRNGKTMLRASSADSWLPKVTPTPVMTGQHPGQLNSWTGLDEYDNGTVAGFSLEPPDQGLCAGNGHVLEMINDVVQVFGNTGTPQHAPVYLNDFFNEPGYQFTTDPSCVYDAGTNRFFAAQLTLGIDPNTGHETGDTWVDVAVSKTGNPLGGYNFYRIYTTDDGTNGTPAHANCPCIGDFPHIGTDAHGLYLTVNEYPFSGPGLYGNNFNGAQLYAMSKRALASGSSVNVVDFQNTRVPTVSGPREPGFTLWPAQSAGTAYDFRNGGTMPFLSSTAAEEARPDDFTGHSNTIGIWQLRNTQSLNSSSPSLHLTVKLVPVSPYGLAPLANQRPGPVPLRDCLTVGCRSGINDQYAPEQEGSLDPSDTRPLTAGYVQGKVIGALDTAMLLNGNVKAGFQWYSVNVTGASPTLSDQGYVGVAGQNAIYPAVATNPQGSGYLGMTLVGNNYYPSAAYMTWSNGPGSTVYISGLGKAPEDGFCEYLYFNCAGTPTPQIRPRWGDYGYAAWDGTQFFVANEWIAHSCTFSQFDNDSTCGGTRTFYGNFSTRITGLANPAP